MTGWNVMEIPSAAAATRFVQQQLKQDVAFAVAGKTLNEARSQGEAVQQLLEGAVELSSMLGKGTQLDQRV